MIETAENPRKAYGISREEQDQLAVRSHQRAIAAHEAGKFADELVPVTVPGKRGKPDTVVDRDENPRADASVEALGALRAIRAKLDPESTVTAGNASGQNDRAAMCVVTTRAEAESRGLMRPSSHCTPCGQRRAPLAAAPPSSLASEWASGSPRPVSLIRRCSFDREFKPRSENAGTYDRLFATYMQLQELAAAAICAQEE